MDENDTPCVMKIMLMNIPDYVNEYSRFKCAAGNTVKVIDITKH